MWRAGHPLGDGGAADAQLTAAQLRTLRQVRIRSGAVPVWRWLRRPKPHANRLTGMTAAYKDPVLSDDQIDDLLMLARWPDAAGCLPLPAWLPSMPYARGRHRSSGPGLHRVHGRRQCHDGAGSGTPPGHGPTVRSVIDGTVKWAGSGLDPVAGCLWHSVGQRPSGRVEARLGLRRTSAFSADGGTYARDQIA